jgi:hypothetical protein
VASKIISDDSKPVSQKVNLWVPHFMAEWETVDQHNWECVRWAYIYPIDVITIDNRFH